jgi:hypothetical protein
VARGATGGAGGGGGGGAPLGGGDHLLLDTAWAVCVSMSEKMTVLVLCNQTSTPAQWTGPGDSIQQVRVVRACEWGASGRGGGRTVVWAVCVVMGEGWPVLVWVGTLSVDTAEEDLEIICSR